MRKPHPKTGFIPSRRRRADGFDLEDVAQADYAIERALGGDRQPLAERLRNAKRLLPAELALAADIVDGTRKVKNPAHRPASGETRKQQMLLALDAWEQMHLGAVEKAAVEVVCEARGKRKRTVQKAIEAHPQMFAGLKRRRRVRGRKSPT